MRSSPCISALVSLAIGLAAQAKVVYVDQNAGGAVHDGVSWSTAHLTVSAGLSTSSVGDEIWVARGLYRERIAPPSAVRLFGGFAGTETLRSQRKWNTNLTILDGDGSASANVVTCATDGVVIDGFTIRNGANGIGVERGVSATLSHNFITRNSADYGGGVYVAGTASLASNTISGNSHGVSVYGSATITSCTITSNGLSGVNVESGEAAIRNCIMAFNSGQGVSTFSASIPSFSGNDVYGNAAGDFSGFTPPADNGNISADPMLSSRYHDIHLQPGSPCIDAGVDGSTSAALDIDGQPRLQGAHEDIGSDESDGTVQTVPSRIWHVSPLGDDANDGLSWAKAKKTLKSAVSAAQGTDEIWVAEGIYQGSVILGAGVALYGGFAGTESDRSQRDWRVRRTVLEGGSIGCIFGDMEVDGFAVQGRGDSGVFVHSGGLVRIAHMDVTGRPTGISVSAGTPVVANCRISGNTNGVYVYAGSVSVLRSDISGNTGCGVLADYYSAATVSGCTISGNETGAYTNHGTLTLTGNLISGSGRVAVHALFPTMVTLTGSTLVNNGTGISLSDGKANLANNIIAFQRSNGFVNGGTNTLVFSHNDTYGNAAADYVYFAPEPGQGNLSVDPLFGDRPSGNYRLQSGSPCIDAGDDTLVASGSTDLDGRPRILGAHVDMGAYEHGSFALPDLARALGIAAGLTVSSPDDVSQLNVEPASPGVDVRDAIRLARKVAGLDPNP